MTEFIPHEAPAQDVKQLPVMQPGRPVGRDDVLQQIYNNHLQARQAVLLHGAPGNGKTNIGAALAAAFTQQPGGVLWIADATHPLAALLVRVGRALGLDDVTTSEQPTDHIASVQQALQETRPFIVLDNVVDALAPRQFIQQCAADLPLLLLSTSALEGTWGSIALEPLDDMAALTLLKQKAGISDDSHDIDIYGLTKLLDYKPLPIVMAARGMVAAKQAPDAYLTNLKRVTDNMGDPVQAAISLNYRALNNALQGLLLMLGATFRGEASVDLLSTVSNVPADTIRQATKVLAQLYLVERFQRYDSEYYRLHPLVYQFAQNALDGRNQLASLEQKVHDATLDYVEQYSTPSQASHAHLAKEIDNILAAAKWAADDGNRETANTLVSFLTGADDFVQQRGYVYELLQLRHYASGSTSAFPAYGPPSSVAPPEDQTYNYDDDDLEDYDDYEEYASSAPAPEDSFIDDEMIEDDESLYDTVDVGEINAQTSDGESLQNIDIDQLRQALTQAKQQGDHARQIQILKAIGKVQVAQNKETEAITTYNEILDAYDDNGDDEGTLDALDMLAALLAKTHNSEAAIMHATRGVQLAQEVGDTPAQLRLLITLGDARQDVGESDEAVDTYAQALEVARQTDDRQHEAIALHKLGEAHLDEGNPDDALHALEQARELFKTQDKRPHEGRVLSALGDAHSDLSRWSEAIGYYQSAVHIAREVRERDDERLVLSKLAQAQEQASKLPDALLSYRQALHLSYLTGQREEIVSAIVDLVRLLLNSQRHLAICDLLLEDALTLEPDDRDVNQLKETVDSARAEADAQGVQQRPVNGTAQQYAANAYALIEQ